jgi:hypothetical protein
MGLRAVLKTYCSTLLGEELTSQNANEAATWQKQQT